MIPVELASLTRIAGGARLSRGFCTLFMAGCAAGVALGEDVAISVVPAVLALPLWLRSLRLGVWAGPSGLMVKSWFRNHWVGAEAIRTVRRGNYDGAFSVGGPTAFLNVIAIETFVDSNVEYVDYAVTVGLPSAVAQRVAAIDDLMRVDVMGPVIVDDGGDITVFVSTGAACREMEPVDVEAGVYEVFDSRGCALVAEVHHGRVRLTPQESGEACPENLLERLRRFITAVGTERFGTSDAGSASLEAVVSLLLQFQARGPVARRMIIDGARTELGRLGVATAGRPAGRFVYVYPDLAPDLWVLVLEGLPADFAVDGYRFGFDNPIDGTERVEDLLSAWSIEWLSGPAEEALEQRFFDIRATLVNSDDGDPPWYGGGT